MIKNKTIFFDHIEKLKLSIKYSVMIFRTVVKIFLFVFLFFLYSVLQTKPEAKEIQKVAIEIMNRAEKEALQRTIEQPFIEKKVARTTYVYFLSLPTLRFWT